MVTTAQPLRIVFFGTPEFAVPSLDALLQSRHQVVGVVTQPDRPRGRGQKRRDAPVKARAVEAKIPVLQPERLKEPAFLDDLAALGADLGVVAAYGKILTDAVLSAPRLGMINVHASLLPKYRGAAPVHRAIIEGDEETGVTIMRVVKELDAGPMLAKARRRIGPDETSAVVERDLAKLGASLLTSVVDSFAEDRVEETPQDSGAATYAHRLTKTDGVIDWTAAAQAVHNRVRGLHPWPHAFTFHRGHRFILLRSAIVPAGGGAGAPGTIVEAGADRLVVAAGSDAVQILDIQAEGKRAMPAREFLAGHRLVPGDRFTSEP
jgi:methionyl-tRNA formyltransferase